MKKPETRAPATPGSDAALESWPQFAGEVRERLEAGKAEYGDDSFGAPVSELVIEIQQEFMDVAGWAFVGWAKLERLKRGLAGAGKAIL